MQNMKEVRGLLRGLVEKMQAKEIPLNQARAEMYGIGLIIKGFTSEHRYKAALKRGEVEPISLFPEDEK